MLLPSTVIRLPSDQTSILKHSAAKKYAKSNLRLHYKSDIIPADAAGKQWSSVARQRTAVCAACEKVAVKG